MSSATDIRAWLRDHGHDVPDKGPISKLGMAVFNAEHPSDDPQPVDKPVETAPVTTGEDVPDVKPAGLKSIAQKIVKPPRPRTTQRRHSIEQLGAWTWTAAANLIGNTGLVPAARVMSFQAPVAGVILDDTLKGTVADRLLQPFARAGDKIGDLGALFTPIVLVTVIQQKPQLYPQLRPMLAESLWKWVDVAGPAMKKIEKRRAARAEIIEEGGIDIDAMIDAIFAPVPDDVAQAEMKDAA